MAHNINHFVCDNKDLNKALKRHLSTAYDPQESSGYHGNMSIHKEPVYKTEEEAMAAIERYDNGWYSDHAVRFKEGRKIKWLVKYEWHS